MVLIVGKPPRHKSYSIYGIKQCSDRTDTAKNTTTHTDIDKILRPDMNINTTRYIMTHTKI